MLYVSHALFRLSSVVQALLALQDQGKFKPIVKQFVGQYSKEGDEVPTVSAFLHHHKAVSHDS